MLIFVHDSTLALVSLFTNYSAVHFCTYEYLLSLVAVVTDDYDNADSENDG